MELGDTLKNNAVPASWRCHSPANQINLLAVRPRDKEPHLAPGIACLPFTVVTLKSAQQGRDFVCFTVPKKALHRRSSDSHSIRASIDWPRARIQAAAQEEARKISFVTKHWSAWLYPLTVISSRTLRRPEESRSQ